MTNGAFCWYAAISTNPKATEKFYTGLFGWKTETVTMAGFPQTIFLANKQQVAGVRPADPGAPSHWLSYVEVENVDKAATLAVELGGKVFVPGTDLPGLGRMALIQDNEGAGIGLFTGLPNQPMEAPKGPNTFCWTELMVGDVERAKKFYTKVVGWTYKGHDMGEMGTYWLATAKDGKQYAGMMNYPPDAPKISYWLPYVSVPNIDETAAKVTKLDGKVLMDIMEVPDVGRMTTFQDPTGAVLAAGTFVEMK